MTLANPDTSAGAGDLVLTDPLPANVQFASVSTNRGGCSGGQTVTCNLDFIAKGIVATVFVTVRVTAAGEIVNTASVRAHESDSVPSNNTDTARVNTPAPPQPQAPPPQVTLQAPRLVQVRSGSAGVLRAARSGGVATVAVRARVDRAATLTLLVRDPRTGVTLTLRPGSTLAGKRLARAATSLRTAVGSATAFDVRALLPAGSLRPGRSYRLVLTASAGGKASRLEIPYVG